MLKKTISTLFLLFGCFASASTGCLTDPEFFKTFEFFGTLLEVNKTNESAGQIFIQPYVYGGFAYGFFSPNWSLDAQPKFGVVTSQLNFYAGLTKSLELDIITGTYSCFYKKKESTALTDTLGGFAYQFLFDDKTNWTPNFRVLAYGIFPTGKGSNLGDHFNGTNASGLGAYGNQFGFSLNKTFDTDSCHPYALNLSMLYSLYYKTRVKGVSALGGGFQTSGVATPGSVLATLLSLEYVLIPHLFLCLDVEYIHTFRSKFKGFVGQNRDGSLAQVFSDTKDGFTLCPAVEYNFFNTLSIYAGAYFTPIGRNVVATAEGVFVLGYQF